MTHLRSTASLASVVLAAATVLLAPAATADATGTAKGTAPHVLVVSPTGSDGNAGTAAAPLLTIQTAVDRLAAGGRVELRGGTYHQRVRLVGVHHLTLAPFGNEAPVLSGAGLTPPKDLTALVEIANSTHVAVRGLDLTAYRTAALDHVPAGIYIHGHDSAVRIVGNHVHDLGNTNGTLGSFDINAHGIAAYGDDAASPIAHLSITDNVVDHLDLGASETVVVNGNVDHWRITGNHIHDNDNIGIDAIGFEPTLTGTHRYTTANRARHGVIAHNVVTRIRSKGNPAYYEGGSGANTQWCNCADGIYVDGGTRITIRHNHVQDDDIGIEVAAENHKGLADHVHTSYNHVTGSLFTGITTGGYCNGADDCGGVHTGASTHNTFEHNVLRGNNRLDDGSPEMLVQYYASHDKWSHNHVEATNAGRVLTGTVPSGTTHDNVSDHNTYRVLRGTCAHAGFGWSGHTYGSYAAYRHGTGQDAHSSCRRATG